MIKIAKIGIKIASRGVSEASRGVLWRLVASRGILSRRLVASRGVSWRRGADQSFAGGVEGVHPTCKGESTMEAPPQHLVPSEMCAFVCFVSCAVCHCVMCIVCCMLYVLLQELIKRSIEER